MWTVYTLVCVFGVLISIYIFRCDGRTRKRNSRRYDELLRRLRVPEHERHREKRGFRFFFFLFWRLSPDISTLAARERASDSHGGYREPIFRKPAPNPKDLPQEVTRSLERDIYRQDLKYKLPKKRDKGQSTVAIFPKRHTVYIRQSARARRIFKSFKIHIHPYHPL